MAQTCSHHDSSRNKVGATAHFVAAFRAKEHSRPRSPLFSDPYAQYLAGNYIEQTTEFMYPSFASEIKSYRAEEDNSEHAKKVLPQGLIDGVAVRTRKIDDEMIKYLISNPTAQVVILGAGLDTRAWRIELPQSNFCHSKYVLFEVDFPEIFDFKLPTLEAAGAVAKFDYRSVVADLSLPGWTEKLAAAGFNPDLPTFWLLEGFTGYLTAEEFHRVFDTMTAMSAPDSRLVATFLTPSTQIATSMHRYTPEVPIEEVTRHAGWMGAQEEIREIGKRYGREWADASMDGYVIVVADYNRSVR